MSTAAAGLGLPARVGARPVILGLLSVLLLVAVAEEMIGLGSTAPAPSPAAGGQSVTDSRLAGMPLYFVENRGQADPSVRYYVQGKGSSVFFTRGGLTMSLAGRERWNLRLDFLGAGSRATPTGGARTGAEVSVFKGERGQWKSGLPTYSRVAYRDVWPGIDLVYSGTGSKLKYAFVVAPGADPSDIRLGWSGASGVRLDDRGRLAVSTPAGGFLDEAPRSYQRAHGRRQPVASSYAVGPGHDYGFNVGSYDRAKPLVIDPAMLVYSGFIGGDGEDPANTVAVDGGGNLYVTGGAGSGASTFPEKVGPDLTYADGLSDAFVAKVNPSGSALLYAGYIGGSQFDTAVGIAVDGAGAAYVTGVTASTQGQGFPAVVGPDLTFNGGGHDAFVAKVKPDGSGLDYAGFIGGAISPMGPGPPGDQGNGIGVDGSGAAYISGFTVAPPVVSGFPDGDGFGSVTGFDQTGNGFVDTFVVKVNPGGSTLGYATYIGGSGIDPGTGLSVDAAGNAYVNGFTGSSEASFPDGDGFGAIPGFDRTFNGNAMSPAPDDAYVAKLNSSGTALVYATYVGGSGVEQPFGNAVDAAGNAYLIGYTSSTEATFPDGDGFGAIPGFDRTHNGGTGGGEIVSMGLESDAFAVKLNAAGTGVEYASYLGGAGDDTAVGIDVDGAGRAHVAGGTESSQASFPVRGGPDSTYNGGGSDAFVARLNASGTGLDYAGYLGGTGYDSGVGLAVDRSGDAYVSGGTDSTQGFPVKAGPDLTQNGGQDAFVAKVRDAPTQSVAPPRIYAGPDPFGACPNRSAKLILGTAAGNALTGTAGADRIFSLAGNDVVAALAGNDCVDLGAGNDRGQGSGGHDIMLGRSGRDRLSGSSGRDRLYGDQGNDRLSAGSGNDRAYGAAGNDRVSAGSGNDRAFGDSGNDRVDGGSGNDRLEGNAGADRITAGRGRDRVAAGRGNDRIQVRDGRRDRVFCGRGRDRVVADRVDRVARDCERVRRV